MKKRFSRIAGVVTACVITALLLSMLSQLTVRKDYRREKGTFLEKAGDCDVLFFGNSRMRDSVFPMEMWSEFGIAGYNLGFPGTSVQGSYWVLLNALERADPELIVVDCGHLSWTTEKAMPYIQLSMPVFPFSLTKIRTALDLFPLEEYSFDDMFSVIWSFSKFHSRWAELDAGDFYRDKNDALGGCECIGRTAPAFADSTPADTDPTRIETNLDICAALPERTLNAA